MILPAVFKLIIDKTENKQIKRKGKLGNTSIIGSIDHLNIGFNGDTVEQCLKQNVLPLNYEFA